MHRLESACPVEETIRPAACSQCVAVNGTLTPCVTAWLRSQVLLPLRTVETSAFIASRVVRRAA
jgi:hypothetical protein